MRPVPAEIEARIRANVHRYFPGLAPAGVEVRCAPFAQTSSYPLVRCEVVAPGPPARRAGVVVKFPPTWSSHDEAETEYRQLCLMAGVVGTTSGALRVPRPLDYYADWSALVTEEVGGERFSRRLLRDASRTAGARAFASLGARVHDCGRWLAAFHHATGAGTAEPFDDSFRELVGARLAQLLPHGLPARTGNRVMETLDAMRSWGAGREAPVAGLHGDFGPQNIHVGEDWVCVFDLSYDRRTIVYDDIAYFLVTLETMSAWPRHPLFDRARALSLRDRFLEGYRGGGVAGDSATILEGYYLKALVFRSAKQRRNVARRGRLWAAAYDRIFLAHRYPARLERQCRRIQQML